MISRRIIIGLLAILLLVPMAFAMLVWIGWQEIERSALAPASAEELVENFSMLAFGGHHYPSNPELQRREEAVRLLLIGDLPSGAEVLPEVLTLFSKVTGRQIGIAQPGWAEQPNGRVQFLERSSYRELVGEKQVPILGLEQSNCTASFAVAWVLIPTDLGEAQTSECVSHELLHLLGFRDHSNALFGSIMNASALPMAGPTINDLILLRTLYDPRLRAGMPREEAMQIVPGIIAELLSMLDGADDAVAALSQRPAP